MGNTLKAHDDLTHVRGWTREQILGTNNSLRRQKKLFGVSKEEFLRYFGGRNKELISVFNNLDTDYDGRVDIFEILIVLSLWGGTTWDDTLYVLFEVFDLMGKGSLKLDDVMMMGSVLMNTLKKFVSVDNELSKPAVLRDLSRQALASGSDAGLSEEQFHTWASGCDKMKLLRRFLEDHAPRSHPSTQEGRIRTHMGRLEKHASRLFERVERLQDRLPDFTNSCMDFVASLGRRKRWDFTMQNLRQLILSLQKAYESMHITLTELDISVAEDESSGGTGSMINPEKRFHQEQGLIDLDSIAKQSSQDFREATELLRRLLDLTEPPEAAVGAEGLLDADDEALVPRGQEQKASMQQVYKEMYADTLPGGMFGGPKHALATSEPEGDDAAQGGLATLVDAPVTSDGGAAGSATLVAVADFEPPTSHETQMLKLLIGDHVTVLGQDGRGWWYGRKANGKEGWFPPSYVQVKSAHFSATG